MSLQWFRMECNLSQNDKILALIARGSDGHRALTLWTFALGWSAGQGTDGHIPRHMLGPLSGSEKLARLLVEARMWEYAEGGWRIHNFDVRQEKSAITQMKSEALRVAAVKANCVRWHGADCGCWRGKQPPAPPLRGVR